jgi:hypothetical protein
MSSLLPLLMLQCNYDYEPMPEELEAQRKYQEELAERRKHTIFHTEQYEELARPEGSSAGGKINAFIQTSGKNLNNYFVARIINHNFMITHSYASS